MVDGGCAVVKVGRIVGIIIYHFHQILDSRIDSTEVGLFGRFHLRNAATGLRLGAVPHLAPAGTLHTKFEYSWLANNSELKAGSSVLLSDLRGVTYPKAKS
jgi:hypothetical protein